MLLCAFLVLFAGLVGCSGTPTVGPTLAPPATSTANLEASPAGTDSLPSAEAPTEASPGVGQGGGSSSIPEASAAPAADPFDLISLESLLAMLEDLTAIQPHSGWRNSATEGEAEALDYVVQALDGFAYVKSLGLELERQSFHVFLATELWDTHLELTVDGQKMEVPADGMRGPRDDIAQALRFDSDGTLNDSDRDPAIVEGPVVVIRSLEELQALAAKDLSGQVVMLDYAVVDRSIMEMQSVVENAARLLETGPAGLVVVTRFSNAQGESHGAFVGDNSAFNNVDTPNAPPILYVRLEDLSPAGIEDWQDLQRIEAARLTWDADVFAPGTSGNLVARIPGADPSRAVILAGHIDSPNAPGAMDDGSGAAIVLEVARVLDEAQFQPPTDLYLVWFGSEELGLYGAYHFVNTHQELLDRTVAMLQIDCLSRPLDGLDVELRLVTWPYGMHGKPRMVWPETLAQVAAERGIEPVPFAAYYAYSDDSTFGGYDVPHADLIYEPVVDSDTSVHYAGHLHDPYDTVTLAREVGPVFEEMANVALAAALDVAEETDSLRVTPPQDRRVLFVASHTEPGHMTPAGFTEMGMTLAMEGIDVDLVPYGQAVTPVDLEDTDVVVVLPVLDYPTTGGDLELYDESWTQAEIDALESYAQSGGLLVLTNSRHRLKYDTAGLDPNEDWADANALASEFGVTYQDGVVEADEARTEGDHPLVKGIRTLELGPDNGIPYELASGLAGEVLAWHGDTPVVTLLDHGSQGGQVLVLADVAILTSGWGEPHNLPFWQNLGQTARAR